LLVWALRPPAPFRQLGVWLFSWAWMAAFLAPFAFQPFVPASGRFAYLASVGAAVALAQVVGFGLSAVSAWREGRQEEERSARWRAAVGALAVVLVAALAVNGAVRLVAMVGVMERAGAVAAGVRGELAAVAVAAPPGPLLVAGHPRFLTDESGVPLAQVLRYGLADSLEPPFVVGAGAAARGVLVYPLPEGPVEGAVAAFRASGREVTLAAWEEGAGKFRVLGDGAGRGLLGRGTARYEEDFGGGQVRYEPWPGAERFRLVVLTRGNPTVVEGTGRVVEVPETFVRSMRHLYSGPVFWWVEAWGAEGELLAVSAARVLPD
jgi:hypothetical protein